MSSFELNGTTFETDEEGYLMNLADWTPEAAAHIAQVENVEMTPSHWEVVNFLRDYYNEYQIAPAVRVLTKAIGKQLGVVEVLATKDEERAVGYLGPDLLGPDWDPDEAVCRLRASPDRPVGEALLDQRNLAGIGNLYKAEVLFLRGIDPWRPVGDVADLALVELARRLLEANKNRIGQVTTGSTGRGQETWVYGRKGRPCRRCSTTIRGTGLRDGARGSKTLDGAGQRVTGGTGIGGTSGARRALGADERVTFWCPHCQPATG